MYLGEKKLCMLLTEFVHAFGHHKKNTLENFTNFPENVGLSEYCPEWVRPIKKQTLQSILVMKQTDEASHTLMVMKQTKH